MRVSKLVLQSGERRILWAPRCAEHHQLSPRLFPWWNHDSALQSSPALLPLIWCFIPATLIWAKPDRFKVFACVLPAFEAIAARTAASLWWAGTWQPDGHSAVSMLIFWSMGFFILCLVLETTENLYKQNWIAEVERKWWKFAALKIKSCRWLKFLQSPLCLYLLYFTASIRGKGQRFETFPFWGKRRVYVGGL